jgi:hypothetical protein
VVVKAPLLLYSFWVSLLFKPGASLNQFTGLIFNARSSSASYKNLILLADDRQVRARGCRPIHRGGKKNSRCLRRVAGLSGRRGNQQLIRQKNRQTPPRHRKTAARGPRTYLRPDGRIPVQVPGTELPQHLKTEKPGQYRAFLLI